MVKERRPDLPVFMISAYGDTRTVDFPQLKQDVLEAVVQARGN